MPIYVPDSLPLAADTAETQLLLPPEEYVNTHEMKSLLANETAPEVAEVPKGSIDNANDAQRQNEV